MLKTCRVQKQEVTIACRCWLKTEAVRVTQTSLWLFDVVVKEKFVFVSVMRKEENPNSESSISRSVFEPSAVLCTRQECGFGSSPQMMVAIMISCCYPCVFSVNNRSLNKAHVVSSIFDQLVKSATHKNEEC